MCICIVCGLWFEFCTSKDALDVFPIPEKHLRPEHWHTAHGENINALEVREKEKSISAFQFRLRECYPLHFYMKDLFCFCDWGHRDGLREESFVRERCNIGGVLDGNSHGTAKSNHPVQSKRWAHKKPPFLYTQTWVDMNLLYLRSIEDNGVRHR